jgi:putative PIN family toxin of toxin-antitoxin system
MPQRRQYRIVMDTNVLVAAAWAPSSASRQIVDAVLAGQIVAVVSAPILREYALILARAVRGSDSRDRIQRLLDQATVVAPQLTQRVVRDDPDDDKFVAAAVDGGAEAIVTNDHHLLALNPYQGIQILRPRAFEQGRSGSA